MAPCLSLIPFISTLSQAPTTKAIPKRDSKERAFQGMYVNKLQEVDFLHSWVVVLLKPSVTSSLEE